MGEEYESTGAIDSTDEIGRAAGGAIEETVALCEAVDSSRLSRLESIAHLDETGEFASDGYTSVSALLSHRGGMGTGEANREVFLARSLPHMPYAHKLAASGQLSISQLEVLAHARSRCPDQFASDEPGLAEAVSGLTVRDSRRAIDYWSQAHAEPPESQEPARVHLSTTFEGRGRIDGDLDPETHNLFDAALDSLMSEMVRDTPRSDLPARSVMRGEALGELARRHLDSPSTPTDHGNRPHLTVVIDWGVLTGADPEGMCELTDGSIITPATARRLACDAKVCRLLTGPGSEILDLGRTRRTVTPAQWRALRVRDRHCQFPGCRRPPRWCDAHHVDGWFEQSGPTDLGRLILVCRVHHTLLHEGEWTLTGTPGDWTFTRPDGSNLPNGPP